MYFKNVIFVAKTCKYGIFVAKIGKYGIFVAKIYKYALIDRFQGSAGFLDSAANCAALSLKMVETLAKKPDYEANGVLRLLPTNNNPIYDESGYFDIGELEKFVSSESFFVLPCS